MLRAYVSWVSLRTLRSANTNRTTSTMCPRAPRPSTVARWCGTRISASCTYCSFLTVHALTSIQPRRYLLHGQGHGRGRGPLKKVIALCRRSTTTGNALCASEERELDRSACSAPSGQAGHLRDKCATQQRSICYETHSSYIRTTSQVAHATGHPRPTVNAGFSDFWSCTASPATSPAAPRDPMPLKAGGERVRQPRISSSIRRMLAEPQAQ